MKGLYIHVPFCKSKCPYCDFYSAGYDEELSGSFCHAIAREMKTGERTAEFTKNAEMSFDTVYLGGGTPSLLGGDKIAYLISAARESYNISPTAEITVECNPSAVGEGFFQKIAEVGVNRISLGMQSAVDGERRALGRLAGRKDVERAIKEAREAGITNISLDIMLGVPNQTAASLEESISFCLDQGVPHISAYMLSLEPGTVFYKRREKLPLPTEDEVCDMYLTLCDRLNKAGVARYEVSNFAKKGFESRHNLKYWRCQEYLGLGPSAHSFIEGKRFFFSRDTMGFINGEKAIFDSLGGDEKEYIMLRLRLSEGLSLTAFKNKFNKTFPKRAMETALLYSRRGLLIVKNDTITLTSNGFLLSNTVISGLLDY